MAGERRRKLTPKLILEELVAIGFARATDYLYVDNDKLCIRPTGELSKREAAAIAAIERTASGVKVKFYDKIKALELLGKHMGMFDGKMAQAGEENNLLEAILSGTKEAICTHDIPEIQQAAAAGNDLVEPSGVEGV